MNDAHERMLKLILMLEKIRLRDCFEIIFSAIRMKILPGNDRQNQILTISPLSELKFNQVTIDKIRDGR